MGRDFCRTLFVVLRSAFVLVSIYLFAPAIVSDAFSSQQNCAIPLANNACGCVSCGCPGSPAPQQPSCPQGQVPHDDYCLPACPEGWTRYPGYPGVCLPPCYHGCPEGYDQVPLPGCPEGYHRNLTEPNYCAPDFEYPNTADDCPTGMVLSPETQQCVVDCPAGYYLGADGYCASYYERNCPPGQGRDPVSGRCVPPGNWPKGYEWICLPHCPEGYVRDIEQPTRCIPPPTECEPGYERSNGRCEPVCAEGTQRDPYGYCVPQSCPEGSYTNLRGACEQMDCQQGYDNVNGQCLPPCSEGYSRSTDGTCVPPDEACPPGTENVGGQCATPCPTGYQRDPVTKTCAPPANSCAAGQELYLGECVTPCKTGTTRASNGQCLPTGCPSGQEKVGGTCLPKCDPPRERDSKNRCLCPQGTEDIGGRCVPNCRSGLERNSAGRCVCPSGTEFVGGKCIEACAEGLVREASGRCVPPACAEGEERIQGRCLPQCQPSFVRNRKGKCVCPEGTQIGRTSGRCEQVFAPDSCPEGYQRAEDGSCEKTPRLQPSCPDGYRYSKRYKTCLPKKDDGQGQTTNETGDQATKPDSFQQLMPEIQSGQKDGTTSGGKVQGKQDCPEGYHRNKKGRCVK